MQLHIYDWIGVIPKPLVILITFIIYQVPLNHALSLSLWHLHHCLFVRYLITCEYCCSWHDFQCIFDIKIAGVGALFVEMHSYWSQRIINVVSSSFFGLKNNFSSLKNHSSEIIIFENGTVQEYFWTVKFFKLADFSSWTDANAKYKSVGFSLRIILGLTLLKTETSLFQPVLKDKTKTKKNSMLLLEWWVSLQLRGTAIDYVPSHVEIWQWPLK